MTTQYVGRHRFTRVLRSNNEDGERFEGWNRKHFFIVRRDDSDQDWDIDVMFENGCYSYQGTWRDSAGKTINEAIFEGMRGSCLEVLE